MASLLERTNVTPKTRRAGHVRNRGNGGRASAAVPYNRTHRGQSKADSDSMWQHTLSLRLTDPPSASSSAGGPRKVETKIVKSAQRQATAPWVHLERTVGIAASQNAKVVEVARLAIFKRGYIFKPLVHHATGRYVVVGLTFTKSDEAKNDVKVSGLLADRLKLSNTLGTGVAADSDIIATIAMVPMLKSVLKALLIIFHRHIVVTAMVAWYFSACIIIYTINRGVLVTVVQILIVALFWYGTDKFYWRANFWHPADFMNSE
ncbi:hypothetical protein BD410DRAFT_808051 [Rickenella mellea]|uniref:Uncharacterized protein n=1 Tax=Rickenella mellea TaxID=50990 RepID=A0A4Y7PNF8_9AGAM|nr:hypothetical protein BD410DRAFT_808051 [Rickenella mellea]